MIEGEVEHDHACPSSQERVHLGHCGPMQGEGGRASLPLPRSPQGDLAGAEACPITPFLPVGCKKADLETLREYYITIVLPDYERPADQHWKGWRRAQYIIELEFWVNQKEQELKDNPVGGFTEEVPICDMCGIPLMVRTNRVTKEEFYGCIRFPACKFTLPMTCGRRPTRMVQKELETEDHKDEEGAELQQEQEEECYHVEGSLQEGLSYAGRLLYDIGRLLASGGTSSSPGGLRRRSSKTYNLNVMSEEVEILEKLRAERTRGQPVRPCHEADIASEW